MGRTSWKRTSGATWAAGTGPASDHTKGDDTGKLIEQISGKIDAQELV